MRRFLVGASGAKNLTLTMRTITEVAYEDA